MDVSSWLAAGLGLLWLLCFIDDNAVNELRLLFHAVTKAACHLYLALLSLRRSACHLYGLLALLSLCRAACHLFYSVSYGLLALLPPRRSACHLVVDSARYALQPLPSSPGKGHPHNDHKQPPAWKLGTLLLLEAMCALCETVPNLTCAALNVGAALCHAVQVVVYLYAATLRAVQAMVLSEKFGEKKLWEKVRQITKDAEKRNNPKVMAYVNRFCQDPVTAVRKK